MVFGASSEEFEEIPRMFGTNPFSTGPSLFGASSVNRNNISNNAPQNTSDAPEKQHRRLLGADGKAPDVVYAVEYVDRFGERVETLESLEPYNVIPEYADAAAGAPVEQSLPVMRVVTHVPVYSPPPPTGRPFKGGLFGHSAPPVDDMSNTDFKKEILIYSVPLINALSAVVDYYSDFRPPSLSSTSATTSSAALRIQAPFRVLVHHRDALSKYRDFQPACHSSELVATTAHHIGVLLGALCKLVEEPILRAEDERLRRRVPVATFDNFWYILRPGEIVFSRGDPTTETGGLAWTAHVVESVIPPGTRRVDGSSGSGGADVSSSLVIKAWALTYTGTKMERRMAELVVPPWRGEQAVHTLPVIPALYFPDGMAVTPSKELNKEQKETQGRGTAIIKQQVELGKKYCALMKTPNYLEYHGELVTAASRGGWKPQGASGPMDGRVICDIDGYERHGSSNHARPHFGGFSTGLFGNPPKSPNNLVPLPQYKPRCACFVCHRGRSGGDDEDLEPGQFYGFESSPNEGKAFGNSDLFYVAITKVMPAFLLGERCWGHVDLAHVGPVQHDRDAFRQLVLEDHIKRTVRALVGKFSAPDTPSAASISPWAGDFVRNKGEGRIFLLHGSPGVGKTCTAECVAELARRPLIALTSGDLGVDPDSVERSLGHFFSLGARYGALVLLDEADVYLERRAPSDVRRNALVGVLLRALEYYRGVLFLTTNRVRAFDAAFTSRVHVALHYADLTDEYREQIWTGAFERLDRESSAANKKVHIGVAAREYAYQSADVRGLKWNGREIRNALQTALALAESEAEENGADTVSLMDRHLAAVVRMSRGFRDFLAEEEKE